MASNQTKSKLSTGINALRNFLVKAAPDQALWILAEASVIGAAAALSAMVFSFGVHWLAALREHLWTLLPVWFVLIGLGTLGGFLCGLIVQYIAPEITGSGIPQVKAILNGVSMRISIRTALSKLVAGSLALGVGLPLGKEGPTVQVGAACGAILSKFGVESPRRSRQLMAAGAGAGLAAAFNAPLAGVMFVIEELLRDVSRTTVTTAFFACFFAAVAARWVGNHSLDLPPNSVFPHADFTALDVPFCIIVGIICGGMGSVFNDGILKCSAWNQKVFSNRYATRVALAGLICGFVVCLLPEPFRNFNGVRDLLFTQRGWHLPLVILVANFLLTIVAYGSGAPGGLFAPSLTIGAATGYLVGLAEQGIFPQTQGCAATLALAGMGAFFTGVGRVPITATVIVFEITTDFNLLLPLMICSITAFIVGEKLSPGSVYDRLLEQQGIHLKDKHIDPEMTHSDL
jgi:chloride channel protein, CIC family